MFNQRIYINENIIENVIKKVLNEAGFSKFRRIRNNTNTQNNKGRIQIGYADLTKQNDLEFIDVILTHIFSDTKSELINNINTEVDRKILFAVDNAKNKGQIILRCNPENKTKIPSIISNLMLAINNVGSYDENYVERLCLSLYDVVEEVPTSLDIEEVEKIKYSNWEEMLQRLEDPEVRKRLLKYQMTNDYARQYGHVLSASNVVSILNQFPSASFVVEASTWKKSFNRTIMANAQPILVKKPIPSNNLNIDLDSAAKICGYNNYEDARTKSKNSTQVLSNIRMVALNNRAKNFYYVKMYDVSQTIPPSNPDLDIWTNKIGLSDNISGVLNNHAEEYDNQYISAEHQKTKKENEKNITQAKKAKWENRRYAIESLCKKNKIDISAFKHIENHAEYIAKTVYTVAKNLAPEYGIIKDDDIKTFAGLTTIVICMSCDCPYPSKLNRYIEAPKKPEIISSVYTLSAMFLPALNKEMRAKSVTSVAVANESYNRDTKIIKKTMNNKNKLIRESKIDKFIKNNKDKNGNIDVMNFLKFCKTTLPKVTDDNDIL